MCKLVATTCIRMLRPDSQPLTGFQVSQPALKSWLTGFKAGQTNQRLENVNF